MRILRPSVGDLRFNLPVAVDAYTGTQTVTSFGPACPQQAFDFPTIPGLAGDVVDWFVNTIYNVITPSAEDCECSFSRVAQLVRSPARSALMHLSSEGLSLNVIVPAGTKAGANLPVAVVSAARSRFSHASVCVLTFIVHLVDSGSSEVSRRAMRAFWSGVELATMQAALRSAGRICKSTYQGRLLEGVRSMCGSYDGNVIVKRSIEMGEPVVYVSMNYRYVLRATTSNAYIDLFLQSFG